MSRFCEELIIWSSDAFAFAEISDAYTTGSSIMPQKKNPDMAELIRGKTGRVYGNLIGLFTTMKGLPLAYNKDMQEDKETVFDASDTVKSCLFIFGKMLKTTKFNKEKMLISAGGGYTNATDAADWLVRKGLPFREAHEIVGRLVLEAISKDVRLEELTLDDFRAISDTFDETVFDVLSVDACVDARNIPGGPAREAMLKEIEKCNEYIERLRYP